MRERLRPANPGPPLIVVESLLGASRRPRPRSDLPMVLDQRDRGQRRFARRRHLRQKERHLRQRRPSGGHLAATPCKPDAYGDLASKAAIPGSALPRSSRSEAEPRNLYSSRCSSGLSAVAGCEGGSGRPSPTLQRRDPRPQAPATSIEHPDDGTTDEHG